MRSSCAAIPTPPLKRTAVRRQPRATAPVLDTVLDVRDIRENPGCSGCSGCSRCSGSSRRSRCSRCSRFPDVRDVRDVPDVRDVRDAPLLLLLPVAGWFVGVCHFPSGPDPSCAWPAPSLRQLHRPSPNSPPGGSCSVESSISP